MAKKKKIRIAFRKNRQKKPVRTKLNRGGQGAAGLMEDMPHDQRMSGKGSLTRHRTVMGEMGDGGGGLVRSIEAGCLTGRVLTPRGIGCLVEADDGRQYECVVRRLLKTISRDERTAVVAGDRVQFRPQGENAGTIERVEPRRGTLFRQVRGQKQIVVANVDQVLIVASAADPRLKPSLIDRYVASAQMGEIRPIICINKVDLVDLAELQSTIGLYAQLGYEVIPTSTRTRIGLERLRQMLKGRETALGGQSGVGKSSLINALEPGLDLRTLDVSQETRKGRHTTTSASLIRLSFGGWVVDTPGVRQLELWNVIPAEVEGFFIEFHPFITQCRYPNCSHTHEAACGVKRAVARGLISAIRYESYCKIRDVDL